MSPTIHGAALAAAICMALPVAAHAQAIQLEEVGAGFATGLSADGTAVVGTTNDNGQVFRWTAATGMVGLGRNTVPRIHTRSGEPAISYDGNVIAATILDRTRAYGTQGRWTTKLGWRQLAPPLPDDGGILDSEDSSVFGMSGDGKVVTGLYWRPFQPGGSAHGSVWRASTNMVGLPTAGGSSRVDAANRDGTVLVGWEEDPNTGSRQAAVWVNGAKTILEPGLYGSEAAGVNADGSIVVGQGYDPVLDRSTAILWRWSGSAWVRQSLGVLKGTGLTGYSFATSVSDDGSIVTGFNRPKFFIFETTGFIWTPDSGMVSADDFLHARGKDLKGKFTIRFVPSVNGAGTVMAAVGQNPNPPFGQRSLLIKLKPETADAAEATTR